MGFKFFYKRWVQSFKLQLCAALRHLEAISYGEAINLFCALKSQKTLKGLGLEMSILLKNKLLVNIMNS